jgi:hypothetical protein
MKTSKLQAMTREKITVMDKRNCLNPPASLYAVFVGDMFIVYPLAFLQL